MKKKEKIAVRALTPAQLRAEAVATRKALASWRTNRYSNQSKNVREGRALRNKLAILLTLAGAKE